MSSPTKTHLIAAKHVLRYLRGTTKISIVYQGSASPANQNVLLGYADASFASDLDTRRSVTGHAFLLNGAAISWESRQQGTVSLSTTESEVVALSSATQQAVHLRLKLAEMGYKQQGKTVIYEDNQPAIHIATNPVTSARSKHIDIKHHFVREKVEEGVILVKYVATEDNIADCLTKPLEKIKFSSSATLFLDASCQLCHRATDEGEG
jgi:hypothetical protein